MAKLSLWFVHLEAPQLERVAFCHPLLPIPRISERGRPLHTATHPFNFQWSPAVRALSFLCVKGVIAFNERGNQDLFEGPVSFSGHRGSPALSLDHAMTKQPSWLFDMFGCDKHGDSLIRRVISRRNSGLKRPGPISLYIVESQLSLEDIRIYLDDREVSKAVEILKDLNEKILDVKLTTTLAMPSPMEISEDISVEESVAHSNESDLVEEPIESEAELESEENTKKGVVLLFPTQERGRAIFRDIPSLDERQQEAPKERSSFGQLLFDELRNSLRSLDIFSARANDLAVSSLWNCDWFSRLAGNPRMFLGEIDQNLPTSLRLGCLDVDDRLDRSLRNRKISVALPAAMVGTLSLFVHMKFLKGYDIDINYNYASTGELLHRMSQGDFATTPDICGLSIATAATLIGRSGKTDFSPLMLTPKTSHRVIGPKHEGKRIVSAEGNYLFDTRETSTASHFFEDIVDTRIVNRNKVSIEHFEAHEMPKALNSGDPNVRAVLWFPFDRLNIQRNNCSLIYGDGDPRQWKETLLFASKQFESDGICATAFDAALRNSWIELIEKRGDLEQVADIMSSDPHYIKTIFRYTGMFDPDTAPSVGLKTQRPQISNLA